MSELHDVLQEARRLAALHERLGDGLLPLGLRRCGGGLVDVFCRVVLWGPGCAFDAAGKRLHEDLARHVAGAVRDSLRRGCKDLLRSARERRAARELDASLELEVDDLLAGER